MIPGAQAFRIALSALLLTWLPATVYAGLLDRTTYWKEQVLLSDGSMLTVSRSVTDGPDGWFRPGRGATLQSTLVASLPRVGEIEFKWKGHEMPTTFDVVDGTPWVVLPIADLDLCEKFGNPAESVVAFSWSNGRWDWYPFKNAPPHLKQNLSLSAPYSAIDAAAMTMAGKRKYDPNEGVELSKGFIPQHMNWEHSCSRINPPTDPAYQRSIEEYTNNPRVALSGKVLETRDDVVAVSREDDRAIMGKFFPRNQRGIIGCKGKVDGMVSIFKTRRIRGGTAGSLTAFRIVLASAEPGSRSIFLPAFAPTPRTHVARIVCSESLIYVVLREEGNVVSVLAYGLGGNWSHAWRIHIPDLRVPDNQWGSVYGFEDRGDRFLLSIGDYHYNGGQSGLPAATLGKRYVIEATKLQ